MKSRTPEQLAQMLVRALGRSSNPLEEWVASYAAECLAALSEPRNAAKTQPNPQQELRRAEMLSAIRELWQLQLRRTEEIVRSVLATEEQQRPYDSADYARLRALLRDALSRASSRVASKDSIRRDLSLLRRLEDDIHGVWRLVGAGKQVDPAQSEFVSLVVGGDFRLQQLSQTLAKVAPEIGSIDAADAETTELNLGRAMWLVQAARMQALATTTETALGPGAKKVRKAARKNGEKRGSRGAPSK